MFGIRKHSDKDLGVFGKESNIVSECYVMFLGLFCLRGVNVVGIDLVTIFDEVDGHGEAHVSKADESDFGEGVVKSGC